MLSSEMEKRLGLILADDLAKGDVTTELLEEKRCRAVIKANEPCLLAGIEEADFLFRHNLVSARRKKRDCQIAKKGDVILQVEGSNKRVLQVERTALNVLARMSGVSTQTAEAVKIAKKFRVKVALTRKTSPGFNLFDKKSAEIAGALPHRKDLSEMVLIKENHLRFFGSVKEALTAAKKKYERHPLKIEVEVTNVKEAIEAARGRPDFIMLDNFSVRKAKEAIREIRKKNKSVKIELSGGIRMGNLREYAKLRPYMVSMGSLTQNAKSINFSMDIV